MKSFLQEVAEDLYAHYGGSLGELKMLLPSRRARLFFSDALRSVVDMPVWEPEWLSIDALMSQVAGLEVGERLRLIAELYNVYREHHPREEFDHFYGWGEILLSDFDMVDKYMIDADQLFRNVSDLKEIESDLSYLSERELRIISFWQSLDYSGELGGGELSRLKENFLRVWRSLPEIYHKFRSRLFELGFAYPGMVHRIAVEKIRRSDSPIFSGRYVVAGFNALSECEKILFSELKSGGECRFYWDWDNYYTENREQEAGLFIRDNILRFPPSAEISHDNFASEKSAHVVSSSSSALQCRYVAEILNQIVNEDGGVDKRTAIVLTDESLLTPLLHSLPDYVGRVNVTMGYPLRESLAYSFVERLIAMQSHARHSRSRGEDLLYHVDVVGLLSHPYLEVLIPREELRAFEQTIRSERLISIPLSRLPEDDKGIYRRLFRRCEGWRLISQYITDVVGFVASVEGEDSQRVEFLSYIHDQIIALHNTLEMCGIDLSSATYFSLLRRHVQSLRIPYEGEPLEGLQVMGILETRNLDFDNVIILSMSDDNFPGNRVQQPSYVPYNLRVAYEMPTVEHHDGVYAYYFYRLIQRSERLYMLYCSAADEKSTGEQSRYITQLDYESPLQLVRGDVGLDVNLFEIPSIEIKKEGRVVDQLLKFVDGEFSLSPTALFQYIACPLRFYFRSLARISVDEELSEEVDAPMFGTILHGAMQELYGESCFAVVEDHRAHIEAISRERIEQAVERAIVENYLKSSVESSLSGSLILVKEVITQYIKGGVLHYDHRNPHFGVLGNELRVGHTIQLEDGRVVRLGGFCDRVDRLSDGTLRIVDYKTGAEHLTFDGVESLFVGEGRARQSNIFQLLLYSYILRGQMGGDPKVQPTLYYVRGMNQADYSPLLVRVEGQGRAKTLHPIESYEECSVEFEGYLRSVLEELFDLSVPFTQCRERETTCLYCDYRDICL